MANGIDMQVIADALNKMACKLHGKSIIAKVDGEHIRYPNACCEIFQEELQQEFNRQQDILVTGQTFPPIGD